MFDSKKEKSASNYTPNDETVAAINEGEQLVKNGA